MNPMHSSLSEKATKAKSSNVKILDINVVSKNPCLESSPLSLQMPARCPRKAGSFGSGQAPDNLCKDLKGGAVVSQPQPARLFRAPSIGPLDDN